MGLSQIVRSVIFKQQLRREFFFFYRIYFDLQNGYVPGLGLFPLIIVEILPSYPIFFYEFLYMLVIIIKVAIFEIIPLFDLLNHILDSDLLVCQRILLCLIMYFGLCFSVFLIITILIYNNILPLHQQHQQPLHQQITSLWHQPYCGAFGIS